MLSDKNSRLDDGLKMAVALMSAVCLLFGCYEAKDQDKDSGTPDAAPRERGVPAVEGIPPETDLEPTKEAGAKPDSGVVLLQGSFGGTGPAVSSKVQLLDGSFEISQWVCNVAKTTCVRGGITP